MSRTLHVELKGFHLNTGMKARTSSGWTTDAPDPYAYFMKHNPDTTYRFDILHKTQNLEDISEGPNA